MATKRVHSIDGIAISTVDWPLIVTEFPEGRLADPALHAMFAYLETLMHEAIAGREKVYFITDLTRMHTLAPASQRKYAAEWMERTAPLSKQCSVGGAQVTPSSILRGLVTAIYWLSPPPTASVFVATRKEAVAGAVAALAAAGVPLPPHLLKLQDTARARR
jgi:hypothetical protein